MEQEEDLLSSLPKVIWYDILSRLSEKDATKTSVLSKAWLDTWNTFPILSFCVTQIIGMPPQPTKKILRFCDYVTRRMLRFRDQNLAIKHFKLKENRFGGHMSKDVDIWLKLACESGVEVIEYESLGRQPYYALPMCVIEAKSLTKLVLLGTTHPFQPIKTLSMSGLQKLKAVEVYGIQEVFIDAPSLEKLEYSPYICHAPSKIDFDRCRNLKELCLGIHFVDLCNLREFVQNIKPHGVLTSLSLIILRAIMFFYETLMRRKDEDCFCSSSDSKCWWHDLKDVKFINSMNIGENVDLKPMLDSLPTLENVDYENFDLEEKISLILEF
ncbi:hypothetical protein TSUD_356300 [Trifolium subterraneum]|uniref:F-box domain-containing protein n=1 Tax=Trifolium subterraneum TaxID=3900 RepID=A0A2Z6MUG5_TRISU|nr:hypothetical protein TSUD_356300 [Trifolium subterraneum]